jgi:phosphatidylethanolamine/phosphatidyl-N-methylethanolamine N-methyltransferase
MIKKQLFFLREFIQEFHSTGSAFPTTKWAAQALSGPLEGQRRPKRILELGPGTGSVTFPILTKMIPGDHLSICEINPRFMSELQVKMANEPLYHKFKENISFFTGAIQDFPESEDKFDVIVCSLPFLNFDLATVEEIFAKLQKLSSEQTVMTYYQYIGLRSFGKAFGSKEGKQRMNQLDEYFDQAIVKHNAKRKRIWLNVLPINVYTLEMAA